MSLLLLVNAHLFINILSKYHLLLATSLELQEKLVASPSVMLYPSVYELMTIPLHSHRH